MQQSRTNLAPLPLPLSLALFSLVLVSSTYNTHKNRDRQAKNMESPSLVDNDNNYINDDNYSSDHHYFSSSPSSSLPVSKPKSNSPSPVIHTLLTDLPDRLTRLARLASTWEESSSPLSSSDRDAITIHQCLDTIESLLDPHPAFTREIVKCRPKGADSLGSTVMTTTSVSALANSNHCPPTATDTGIIPKSINNELRSQLKTLLNEVTALKLDLEARREESFRIYDLLNHRCTDSTRRITELQDEIQELQCDILQDSIEREGLQGTVRGLDDWVTACKQQHDLNHLAKTPTKSASEQRKRRRKVKDGGGDGSGIKDETDNDYDALVEGIAAWMRGWRDAEDGFRTKELGRRLRREERRRV